MTYTTFDELNNTGISAVLTFPNVDTPIFWPIAFQLVLFFIIMLGSYYAEKQRIGVANILSSAGISAVISILVGLALRLLTVIDKLTFLITLSIGLVICGIWLLSEKN